METNEIEHIPNCQSTSWSGISKCFGLSSLSFLCLNARSIVNKFAEFVAHLHELDNKFSFILITETWLDSSRDKAFEIDGYKSISLYRESRRGGGLKIYYLDSLTVLPIDNLTCSDEVCERLFVHARIRGFGDLTVGGVYRPPDADLEAFDNTISNVLDEICMRKSIILGDMNINILEQSIQTLNYIEMFASYGFINEVNLPTYVSPATWEEKSCLDHIQHNLPCGGSGFVISPGISDHLPVAFVANTKTSNKTSKIKFRDFSDRNKDSFRINMQREFSQCDPPNIDVNNRAGYLEDFLKRLQNKYFPIKTKTVTEKRCRAPWMSRDIILCIRRKFFWHSRLKRGLVDIRFYKLYCCELRKLLCVAEREFYRSRLKSLKNDPKRNWRILNGLLNKKKTSISEEFIIDNMDCSDPKTIADAFCKYFIDHPKRLNENIRTSDNDYLDLVSFNEKSMNFFPCSRAEIFNAITALKKEGSMDDLSPRFLKICGHLLSYYLCQLFNLCVENGVYPDRFKIARVIPIYKKGPRNSIANHRPVSILCNLAKVFESIIFRRINNFFEMNGLLSARQFGFRKEKNTELASFQLIDNIMPSFVNGHYCITVFLDYSAAFDTIRRELLFEKLYRYGIRGVPLRFIKSYFSNRKQYVEYLGVKSSTMEQTLGSVQGSKCAAMFFDIYTNDLSDLFRDDNVLVAFADDTTINFVHENLNDLIQIVNGNLIRMIDWSCFNKLSLNPSKSEFMLITNKHNILNPIVYTVNSVVRQSKYVMFLGVYITR